MYKILVWSVLYYLRFWARIALRVHRPYVIGIAGSVGKSSTRNILNAGLKDKFKTKVVSGNSETGVPLGILGLPIEGYDKASWVKSLAKAPFSIFNLKGTQYLIVEMGIDDPFPPKNMSYLLTIIKPDMAIDLNATATHTQQFEKLLGKRTKNSSDFLLEKIAEEDSKIITNGYTKVGIYNADDLKLSTVIRRTAPKEVVTLLTFGSDESNTVSYAGYEITTKKTKFSYRVPTERGGRTVGISFSGRLLPQASAESFAAVLAVSYALRLEYEEVIDSIERNFTIPKGRSSLLEGIKNSIIVDSSYNSSKSTVLSFLAMARILKEKTDRPVVFLMGDMRELGNESKREHEQVAQALLPIVDELHCVGNQTLEYVIPLVKNAPGRVKPKKIEWYKNAVQAGLHLKESLPQNAILLVKGSQNTIYLEEAIKFLLINSSDVKKLPRQEEYWIKTKKAFFNIQ